MGNSKSRNITKPEDNTKQAKGEAKSPKESSETNKDALLDADKNEATPKTNDSQKENDTDENKVNKADKDQEVETTTSKTEDQSTSELQESPDNLKIETENSSTSENVENITKTSEQDHPKEDIPSKQDDNQIDNTVKEHVFEVEIKTEILPTVNDDDKNVESEEKKEIEVHPETSSEDLHKDSETHDDLKTDKSNDDDVSITIENLTKTYEEINKESEEKQENEADEKKTPSPVVDTANVENDSAISTTDNSGDN